MILTTKEQEDLNSFFSDFSNVYDLIENEEKETEDQVIARWYQKATVARTIKFLNDGFKRVLIVLPTGAGKTHTSRMLFKSKTLRDVLGVQNRPLKLLFVTHKHRLSTQASRIYDKESNIIFIKQSVYSPIPQEVIEEGWDVTCVDEAHHEAMYSFQLLLDSIKQRPLIGLTATPNRKDGFLLKFQKIVCEISRKQAVEQGFLAKTFLNSVIDTGSLNKVPLIKELLDNYLPEFGQTIIFMRTKKEVKEIETFLLEKGVAAIALLDQSEQELDHILDLFSDGKYQFLINCQKINEGVDVKNCEHIILGRQYNSANEINQAVGRASRPDSDCNVWQLINPTKNNLDTTDIVGEPETHRLISFNKRNIIERFFNSQDKIIKDKKVA